MAADGGGSLYDLEVQSWIMYGIAVVLWILRMLVCYCPSLLFPPPILSNFTLFFSLSSTLETHLTPPDMLDLSAWAGYGKPKTLSCYREW